MPGPKLAADAAQVGEVMEQGVDQRSARMPRRRVDDHARGLVEHDQIRILEENPQRQRLGLGRGGCRRRNVDGVVLAGTHRGAWPQRAGGPGDAAVLDQALQLRAGLFRQDRSQEVIETRPVVLGVDFNGTGSWH